MTIGGNLTNWFQIRVGVCQGYNLSPTPFTIFHDIVMKDIGSLDRVLNMSKDMTLDINYADDTKLISTVFEKLQIATNQLNKACKRRGLKVQEHVPTQRQVCLDNEVIEKL